MTLTKGELALIVIAITLIVFVLFGDNLIS